MVLDSRSVNTTKKNPKNKDKINTKERKTSSLHKDCIIKCKLSTRMCEYIQKPYSCMDKKPKSQINKQILNRKITTEKLHG